MELNGNNTETTCCYLTGVLGLPGNFRGERTLGSKENFSLTFSSTDGATYVKPWGRGGGQKKIKKGTESASSNSIFPKTTHS